MWSRRSAFTMIQSAAKAEIAKSKRLHYSVSHIWNVEKIVALHKCLGGDNMLFVSYPEP